MVLRLLLATVNTVFHRQLERPHSLLCLVYSCSDIMTGDSKCTSSTLPYKVISFSSKCMPHLILLSFLLSSMHASWYLSCAFVHVPPFIPHNNSTYILTYSYGINNCELKLQQAIEPAISTQSHCIQSHCCPTRTYQDSYLDNFFVFSVNCFNSEG